ncbi:MAG TPA: 1,4-alpha-glucan branching protein GlgB [Ktedonobacterales bacterium]|nr:1,4-alpha-glucan branching protein GlgB [Ktedonobacterales bacterium]
MGETSSASAESARIPDPLDAGNLEALIAGRHGAPFDVLGSHVVDVDARRLWIVRVFRPYADAIAVVPDAPAGVAQESSAPAGSTSTAVPMVLLHEAGLFTLVTPLGANEQPPAYHLDIHFMSGATLRTRDPYALLPVISEYDLYLIGEGKDLRLYNKLGAHPVTHQGVEGVLFAVWAPSARRVSVVGNFNGWDERVSPMRLRPNGVWELFWPGLQTGEYYKYAILSWVKEYRVLKSDPVGFFAEERPGTASRVVDLDGYRWADESWTSQRERHNGLDRPMSVYEVHPGSWRWPSDGDRVTYRDLAHQLVPYVRDMGYTHVELMGIAEYPYDGSWGYQVTGYYAPTSRYGTPDDFMYFVDYCHQHEIGVLLDWVPAHFPRDEHGLSFFDGTHLYEHSDPRQGAHPDWGTLVFNYGRNEVRNFFVANALYWLDKFHIDGLRVDAVASMLYLDYSRKAGEWVANRFGGRENLEAIDFLRTCNATVAEQFPHALMIAEESTAWSGVTHPVSQGGLGFSLKWNMGWMHDTLEYMKLEPIHRRFHHGELTFSMVYAYSEKFILPFSHDEVVHIKGSMLNKMPGDTWQKFANLRALYAYMYGHPGKKLLFMGGEFGQWAEWNFAGYLEWNLLDEHAQDGPLHLTLQRLVRDLNGLMRDNPCLYELDFSPDGFRWIDFADASSSVISFIRTRAEQREPLVFVCNFTPVVRYNYRIGVPPAKGYSLVLNTDAAEYGGSSESGDATVSCEDVPMHGYEQSISLTLPPLATVVLRPNK